MVHGQISPGKLTSVHSHLEGISNCTKCHELGDKVTNAKCLACHTELKTRVDQNLGYHASSAIKGKTCISCHSDHHGVNFQIVRFDREKFNHTLAGYQLTGAHAQKKCADCHQSKFISDPKIRAKKSTFLGLSKNCVPCHTDYHQKTLSQTCSDCHGDDAFKPAAKFSHANAAFKLNGSHANVPCTGCHKVTTKNGVKFQEFSGILFKSCVNCHTDVHQNKFGSNCSQCHSEVSFHNIKGISNFDHSKTRFKLVDKHAAVSCKSCHKVNLTDPVKHDLCTDCHSDYHKGQFVASGKIQDCALCHSTKGFAGSSFTVERHNAGQFSLQGAHLATPCSDCHKTEGAWNFRNIGTRCVDCHDDIHAPSLSPQYYPGKDCRSCHSESSWNTITFDHLKTSFPLTGAHALQTCRTCHFPTDKAGRTEQRFSGLSDNCTNCHQDIHNRQFDNNGVTNCLRCHAPDRWKITNFDHNKTAFKLDGKHQNVPCAKCHKPVSTQQKIYVLYKIRETKCENCH